GGTIPTMVSYQLGLTGPSIFVQSNCSSSLSGLFLACQSLKTGKSKACLVGAATVYPVPDMGYVHEPGLNYSSDGRCKVFDASADGMVGGEGAAVIMVKRANDAIRDGDHIYALLRGIGLNNDGAEKSGFYAPSVKGQSEVISQALQEAKVDPQTIAYLEAHGTGTNLGDPVEILALSDAYRLHTDKTQFCAIGSVKSNIGHLDSAAGLAGCIKVALTLGRGEIPPTINYCEPNSAIDFESSPFYVVDKLKRWDRDGHPRRAGLSSFGIGGTNAHAILEEFEDRRTALTSEGLPAGSGEWQIVVLSARSKERLRVYAKRLQRFLRGDDVSSPLNLRDLAYTLQIGRKAMQSRVSFLIRNAQELIPILGRFAEGEEGIENCYQGDAKRRSSIVILFEAEADYPEKIANLWREGKSREIAKLWAEGVEVDWHAFYQREKRFRLSLPTYPFLEEPYWVDPSNQGDRPIVDSIKKEQDPDGLVVESLIAEPIWRNQAISTATDSMKWGKNLVLSYGAASPQESGDDWQILHSDKLSLSERNLDISVQAFTLIQGFLRQKRTGPVLAQLHIPLEGEGALCAGLSGLMRTAHLENPQFFGQVIECDAKDSFEVLQQRLIENRGHPDDIQVRYRDGVRQVLGWSEKVVDGAPAEVPWKEGGVYLITGGLGGLGTLFAREISQRGPHVTLILVGRSKLNAKSEDVLYQLSTSGVRVEYRQVDVSRSQEVNGLVQEINREFGVLNGILHAAGISEDNYILRKGPDEWMKVLEPKTAGTVNLDLATRDQPLDFFVLFSSIAGAMGNPGQADYATANAFMDAYANYRNRAIENKKDRSRGPFGRCLSINWPFWSDGGFGLSLDDERAMTEATGLRPLKASTGFQLFYKCLASNLSRALVAEGDLGNIRAFIFGAHSVKPTMEGGAELPVSHDQNLLQKTLFFLKVLVGDVFRMPVDRIDSAEPLETYGID
ncbi:MAG: SDR family NAD(P)-dependent oxidoreductase, partial [Verrucomicrobia bacterium]|nr:SDR family NAD(P)-dependent oxidoreductase [Verrucomicrobiota bacterium]